MKQGGFSAAYELGELLGKGTFGDVRVATELATGRQCAVKVMVKSLHRRDRTDEIRREVAFCEALQACAGVVRLFDVYEDAGRVYIVQELCAGGDVASLQCAASDGRLDEHEAAAVALAVLRFLAHAHRAGVCYGDVKPNNFVLRRLYPSITHMLDPTAPKGRIDLAVVDFGCCQRVKPDECLPDVVSRLVWLCAARALCCCNRPPTGGCWG